MPMVSVLMGVLCKSSRLPLLKEALDSLLSQTFTDIEILICDDGSDVDVCDYLNVAAQFDKRIKLVRSGKMITLPQKLNFCLKYAGGNLIARMDDDDFSYPDRFKEQVVFLEEHKDIAFVGCNVDLYDDGSIVGRRSFPEYPEASDFLFRQPFIHPALMFRRSAFAAVEGYSEEKKNLFCEHSEAAFQIHTINDRKGQEKVQIQDKRGKDQICPIQGAWHASRRNALCYKAAHSRIDPERNPLPSQKQEG